MLPRIPHPGNFGRRLTSAQDQQWLPRAVLRLCPANFFGIPPLLNSTLPSTTHFRLAKAMQELSSATRTLALNYLW
jgi:hypothetical protein